MDLETITAKRLIKEFGEKPLKEWRYDVIKDYNCKFRSNALAKKALVAIESEAIRQVREKRNNTKIQEQDN